MLEKKQIKTSGDLRRFVCDAMMDVRYGHLDVNKGAAISKMAAQINESLRIELVGYKMMIESGKDNQAIGCLPLTLEDVA